jgi:hypothetical protein
VAASGGSDAGSGASGRPDQRIWSARRVPLPDPDGSIRLGLYKYVVIGLGLYSCSFILRIHPSEPSHSSFTHLVWLIHHLVRLESIQVHCFEWLHLEALGDCVSLWDSLVIRGGCHHLDGLVQRGSSSGGRCLFPASIVVIVRGSWPFPGGEPKDTLVDCL